MARLTIDTNVPIVANGRPDPNGGVPPSVECRISAVTFLNEVYEKHTALVDLGGAIEREYARYLKPCGQPGVGDRFYQAILMSAPTRVERIEIEIDVDGQYSPLPDLLRNSQFDQSDRKFAALSIQENVPVAFCTDSDWVNDAELLSQSGVTLKPICGLNVAKWFAPAED